MRSGALELWLLLVCSALAASCSSSGSTSGSGGSGGSGGGAGGAHASGLPVPPGGGGQAKPAGAPGNLTVLDWAGFKSAVSWTFDDAQPSQIAHYAELAAVGVPVTYYIITGLSGSEAGYDTTWSQAIADGSEVGNHTVHHCHADLTGCTTATGLSTAADELDQASQYIADHYPAQGRCWTAASPYGDTGYDSADATRFLVNRGVNGGTIGAKDATDPFNLPTYTAQTGDTAAVFNAKIDAAHAGGRWQILLVHSITPTDQLWYNPVAITDVTASMAYAKSLGDVWSDSVVHVAAYWLGQKLLAAAVPASAGTGQTWSWTLPPNFPPGRYVRVTLTGGTPTQAGVPLAWDDHGYYEVALDAGELTVAP